MSVVRAEWTKLRTVRSTWWLLFALAAVTIALGAALTAGSSTDADVAGAGDNDTIRDSLAGVYAGMLAIAAFGALAFTSEHATRMILATFAAMPRRGTVLLVKAALVGLLAFVAGLITSAGAFVIGQELLRDGGFVPPAYREWTLADGPALRAVVGTALFLGALAVLSLAAGAILRNAAAAITIVIGLLLVPLIVAPLLPERAGELVQVYTPAGGLAVQQTRDRADALPLEPWQAIAVTAGWALAALLVALVLVRRRDP